MVAALFGNQTHSALVTLNHRSSDCGGVSWSCLLPLTFQHTIWEILYIKRFEVQSNINYQASLYSSQQACMLISWFRTCEGLKYWDTHIWPVKPTQLTPEEGRLAVLNPKQLPWRVYKRIVLSELGTTLLQRKKKRRQHTHTHTERLTLRISELIKVNVSWGHAKWNPGSI